MPRAALAVLAVLAILGSLLLIGRMATHPAPLRPPASPPRAATIDAVQLDSHWRDAECWFEEDWRDWIGMRSSRCGWLFPSGQDSQGRRAALPVVVLPAAGFGQSSARATVYVSGGPGSGSYLSTEGIAAWKQWRDRLGLDHDLVLYDQRGTGAAWPPLDCPELVDLTWDQLDSDADRDQLWAEYEAVLLRCADQVPEADRAAGLYSTRRSADDLRQLLLALQQRHGYEALNLYGVSYGTRLSLEVLDDAQLPVAAAVLDSPYPPGLDLVGPFADHFAGVLEGASRHCIGEGRCPHHLQFRTLLDSALQALREQPVRLEVSDDWLERAVTVRIDDATLMMLLEHALYAGWPLDQLADLLQEAERGSLAGWQALVSEWLWVSLDPDFDSLTLHLVECRDNPPLDPAVEAAALARQPSWQHALMSPQRSYELCERLGVPAEPLVMRSPQVPVLALAAEFDPRTPAGPGLAALEGLSKLSVLRRPISGHGLVDVDDCAAREAGRFLNHAGGAQVDACVE